MSSWSPDVFAKAWDFATLHHHRQTYGGPEEGMQIDYLNHIGSVAVEVIWALPTAPEADGDLAVQCALLHDTIEDTAATYEVVAEQFGARVAEGVRALSKDASIADKARQMEDSLRRIRAQGREVWMVKLADRITNLYHPPYYWKADKIASYLEEATQIHAALREGNAALAGRLAEKIRLYRRFLET